MTVDDLKHHYGVKNDSELAEILNKTRGAISKWRSKGIPLTSQALLQVQSNNKLKANIQSSSP